MTVFKQRVRRSGCHVATHCRPSGLSKAARRSALAFRDSLPRRSRWWHSAAGHKPPFGMPPDSRQSIGQGGVHVAVLDPDFVGAQLSSRNQPAFTQPCATRVEARTQTFPNGLRGGKHAPVPTARQCSGSCPIRCASRLRPSQSSLRKAAARWVLTVVNPMPRARAMSLSASPS
jgi:hypothetical protein